MRRLMWRIEAMVLGAGLALLRALGPVRASNLAGAVARMIGPWLPVTRVAQSNLRRALPSMDARGRRHVIRGMWDNLGRTVGELPHLAAIVGNMRPDVGWELAGADIPTRIRDTGARAILFSAHYGNWEVLLPAAQRLGLPVGGLYRAPSNPLVDVMLLRERAAGAVRPPPMWPKGAAGARGGLVHLKDGGVLALLMDQKMNDGIDVRFFGQPAMTASALASLALRFRCPVVPCRVERLGAARFRVSCEAPLDLPDSGDRSRDAVVLTQSVNDRIEGWVRERPEGWLWLHNRWPQK